MFVLRYCAEKLTEIQLNLPHLTNSRKKETKNKNRYSSGETIHVTANGVSPEEGKKTKAMLMLTNVKIMFTMDFLMSIRLVISRNPPRPIALELIPVPVRVAYNVR